MMALKPESPLDPLLPGKMKWELSQAAFLSR